MQLWGSTWRKIVKARASKFDAAENPRHAWQGKLFLDLNGCRRCPYNATNMCPYGVGRQYHQDVKAWGTGKVVHKMGEIKEYHPRGICPEREFEIAQELKMCTNLDGLRMKRAHSLIGMEKDIARIKGELDKILSEHGLTIEDYGAGATPKGGPDKRLITLFKEYVAIHHKYHEKLDNAIAHESKYNEAKAARLSTDDINSQLKLASKIIDIEPEEDASSDKHDNDK